MPREFFTERFNLLAYLWNGRVFLLLNLAIISSAVSSPFFTFFTAVLNAKPSLGSESIKRLRLRLARGCHIA